MKEKKEFVEPEMVKCEESLDKVTLCFNGYSDNTEPHPNPHTGPFNWRWGRH